MGLKKNVFKQFGQPTGILGELVGWSMAVKNRERSSWTVQKLDYKPSDYLLEIGFGPGSAIKMIADQLTSGFIAGIDHSEIMFGQATKRNKKHIENKKVKLECGTASNLDYPAAYFDIIYGSNVHFFWKYPVNEFQKLKTFLKSNGRLIMVFQPRWATSEQAVVNIAEITKEQFKDAGFNAVDIDFKRMRPVTCIYICGQE